MQTWGNTIAQPDEPEELRGEVKTRIANKRQEYAKLVGQIVSGNPVRKFRLPTPGA